MYGLTSSGHSLERGRGQSDAIFVLTQVQHHVAVESWANLDAILNARWTGHACVGYWQMTEED